MHSICQRNLGPIFCLIALKMSTFVLHNVQIAPTMTFLSN